MGNVLVIGDACTDVFVYCHCNRLCPEAPVPLLEIEKRTSNTGMAGNLANNLAALGNYVDPFFPERYYNTTKTRYVDIKTNHMFTRIDDNVECGKFSRDLFTATLKNNANFYDAVVISDYNKGFLSEEDIEFILSNAELSFIDTKKHLGDWIKNATFIKINEHEFKASKSYIKSSKLNNIIETAGGDGCYYNNKHYPVNKVGVIDVSGAGDTFLAGLVHKYIITQDIDQSINFANACAQQIVQEPGVSIINPSKLVETN